MFSQLVSTRHRGAFDPSAPHRRVFRGVDAVFEHALSNLKAASVRTRIKKLVRWRKELSFARSVESAAVAELLGPGRARKPCNNSAFVSKLDAPCVLRLIAGKVWRTGNVALAKGNVVYRKIAPSDQLDSQRIG